MKFSKYTLIALSVLIFQLANAQVPSGNYNKPEIVPPSPTAQIFEEYGNVPVSLYTGIPDIKIPLWTIKSGKLELPIYLSYNASGVRVDELPGMVGLKWCLNYGGMISRNVYGKPDDEGWLKDDKKLPDDWDLNLTYEQYTPLLRAIAYGCKDGQPDEYNISLPTLNCKFVFDKNNQPATIPYRHIAITPGTTDLNAWTINDESGNTYILSTFEYISKSSHCEHEGNNQSVCSPDGQYKSGWMLDAMYSADYSDTILFEYYNNFTVHVSDKLVSETYLFNDPSKKTDNYFGYLPPYYISRCYEGYIYDVKIPKKIITRNQIIEFIASAYVDPNMGAKIDLINIYTSTYKKIKSFSFGYTTLGNNSRPALCSITEIAPDGTTKPPYELSYNPIQLPDIYNFGVDYYGYFNGKIHQASLIPNNSRYYVMYKDKSQEAGVRTVDPNYNQAGTLVKIKYPTGGVTDFTYETHKTMMPQKEEISQSSRTFSYIDKETTGWFEDIFTVASNNIDVSLSFVNLSNYTGSNTLKPYFQFTDSAHHILYEWTASTTTPEHLNLKHGTYYVRFHLNDLRDYGTIGFKVFTTSIIPAHEENSGGLRISKITDYDETGTIAREKLYQYNKFGSTKTSGGEPFRKVNFEYIYGITRYNDQMERWEDCHYPAISSVARGNMGLTHGSYVGYTDVTEIIKGKDYQYKSLYKFYGTEVSDRENGSIVLYTPNDSREYKRGIEQWKEEYDTKGNLIRKSINSYAFNGESPDPTRNCKVVMGLRAAPGGVVAQGTIESYKWEEYCVFSEWFYNDGITQTMYEVGSPIEKSLNYSYANPTHAQLTKVSEQNSEGKTIETEYSYPADNPTDIQTSNATLNLMIQRNMQAKLKTEKKVDGSTVEGEITNYSSALLPSSIYIKKDGSYEPRFYYDSYDNLGNPTQYHKSDDIPVSYLWGYNQTYPVAKIENATLDEVKTLFGGTLPDLGSGGLSASQNSLLRSGLPKALITTYTYAPLVGMTSQTDPGGVTIYYEYDTFGRLKCTRDDDGNILKTYEYNYKH